MLSSMQIGAQTPAQSNDDLIFEVSEFDKYDFPYDGIVPEGWYYAMITEVRSSQNRYHDPCFDVYFKLLSQNQPPAWQKGSLNTLTYYFIRQRYKVGSMPELNFKNAMHKTGLPKRFTSADLIGHIVFLRLEYSNHCRLGSIEEWQKTPLPADWFTADEEEDLEEEPEI